MKLNFKSFVGMKIFPEIDLHHFRFDFGHFRLEKGKSKNPKILKSLTYNCYSFVVKLL
jgi:hypothetical protein